MPNYIVRYGYTRNVAEFAGKNQLFVNRDDEVIIRTDRGLEWGEVLCEASDRTREYLKQKGDFDGRFRVLRVASEEDRKSQDGVHEKEREQFSGCREMIAERKMQMSLVDVECIFGGERLVFYYLAEKRVDFRELVKALAKRFCTRIEMRQIGVRDEAKLLADYGDCGKPVCCNTHLREMPPVSMKMAKLQKATLDPNKISGRCGRLKCCLRYEYDTYDEYRRELPRIGATVITQQGQGKVIAQEVLSRKVLVSYEGGSRALTDLNEIVTTVSKAKSNESSDDHQSKSKPNERQSGDSGRGKSRAPSTAAKENPKSQEAPSQPPKPNDSGEQTAE